MSVGLHMRFKTAFFLLLSSVTCVQAQKKKEAAPVFVGQNKQLSYTRDSLGNRIPDFSYCGYEAGNIDLPFVPAVIRVPFKKGDATARIQEAINYIASLPLQSNGFRGAVILQKGVHEIEGTLFIRSSGIVLRGENRATILRGVGKDRATLIRVEGDKQMVISETVAVKDSYVPVNAMQLQVANGSIFREGALIQIRRPSTMDWIKKLGTEHFGGGITSLGWKPNQRDLIWFRKVNQIQGHQITLDAPLTMSLDSSYGGATVSVIQSWNRIDHIGIEQLQLESSYDMNNPKDESHRWMAITMDAVENSFVRNIQFKNFAGSAVAIYDQASKITVQDCISLHPVSEIAGERRNTFFTEGQQILFQRCFAEFGMHDFATGFCAAGPTAFVQCTSSLPYSFSGGIDSWSAGVLFDIVNVDGHAISFSNLGQERQGAGWNIANSLLWNCSAARIDCYRPPTAQNWAFGSWSQFSGDGYWAESNNSIEPRSYYYAQLKDRIGASALQFRIQVMDVGTEASSSPSIATAMELTKLASTPLQTLQDFIQVQWKQFPSSEQLKGVKDIDTMMTRAVVSSFAPPLTIQNGYIAVDHKTLIGGRQNEPWWNGSARRYALHQMQPALTRFVPGRSGKGLTDDLGLLTDSMVRKGKTVMDHNYGLWYERRRDDHERIRRIDGDVWAPFYELPFARSGKGTAWDGLSQYDLNRYNDWYWLRLKQYTQLANTKGLVLFQQHYFQHNIIEAGAHYADFPWRTANNINGTGFPEPVPYAGDKRIFMADQFYDTANAQRASIHRAFIRKSLENYAEGDHVIHFIGEEFTGPLHFVQFWLNTIRQWEKEKNRHPLIALSTTKDVQDAILANPNYNQLVDVIDIKYWYYQAGGTVYAPLGGQNLAPRQHARLMKPKSTAAAQVYRAVLEYKLKYPDKAVIYSADGFDRYGAAILMAGGSLPDVKISDADFLKALVTMKPVPSAADVWMMKDAQQNYLLSSPNANTIQGEIVSGTYQVRWVNLDKGTVSTDSDKITGPAIQLSAPGKGNYVLWLIKEK